MYSCAVSSWVFGGAMLVFGLVGACETRPPSAAGTTASKTALPTATGHSQLKVDNSAANGSPIPPATRLEPCGELHCGSFDDAASALELLLRERPRIVAVGEAHARQGRDDVTTPTEYFEKELLPVLAKHGTSELVVELLKPAPECQKPVAKVEREQQQVTREQAPENKNRFVSLGHAAKSLNVTPYLLEPECSEYQRIAEAGSDAIVRMLEVIASETSKRVQRFYTRQSQRAASGDAPLLVVAYGGAMHNDLQVSEEKATFSFGPELKKLSADRYIELDLIVPEFIQDTEIWRALPWYSVFDASKPRTETTLIRTGPSSYVLIFPHSTGAVGAASRSSGDSPASTGRESESEEQ